MTKVLKCRDLGTDCDFVARAETEEDLFKIVAEHGKEVHSMEEVPPEMLEKARAAIREE